MSPNVKDYGEITVETRTIINKEACFDNDSSYLQWYPDRYFLNGDVNGTFRHANCMFAAYKGVFVDGMCSFCASLPKLKSFQRRLERQFRSESNKTRQAIPYENRSKEELVNSLRDMKHTEEGLKKENFLLKCDLQRLQIKSTAWKAELKELSSKGSFTAVATKLERKIKSGSVRGKDGIMSILKTICSNAPKKKKGY